MIQKIITFAVLARERTEKNEKALSGRIQYRKKHKQGGIKHEPYRNIAGGY